MKTSKMKKRKRRKTVVQRATMVRFTQTTVLKAIAKQTKVARISITQHQRLQSRT